MKTNREFVAANASSWVGLPGVFVEVPLIITVCSVKNIALEETLLKIYLSTGKSTFNVSAPWDVVMPEHMHLANPYLPWHLYLHPGIVSRAQKSELISDENAEYVDRYVELDRIVCEAGLTPPYPKTPE